MECLDKNLHRRTVIATDFLAEVVSTMLPDGQYHLDRQTLMPFSRSALSDYVYR